MMNRSQNAKPKIDAILMWELATVKRIVTAPPLRLYFYLRNTYRKCRDPNKKIPIVGKTKWPMLHE